MKQGRFDLVAGEISQIQAEKDQAALSLRPESGSLTGRRAKIIATIGPASNSEAILRDLLRLGMDVARLNFSHGTHEDHARNIERIRRAARKEGRTVCILQDLQGPKIRTGRLKGHEPVLLKTGSQVTITSRDVLGTSSLIPTTFAGLSAEVSPGARILLSDGLIELRVRGVRDADVECDVVNGGMLAEHQGINLPGIALTIPALTEKDRKDLEFGIKHEVDVVAISFVRSASDVREVKQLILSQDSAVPVIAKLEKPQALEQLEEIFEAADGVMVARGDLGVEMLPEQVPVIQKHVIRRAAEWRKPVITATQMLESMIENPRPTRAEASDVANAIFDGTDAVMLSGETAGGRYPRETVAMMSRIVVEAEHSMVLSSESRRRRNHHQLSIAETICESIARAADDLPIGAIAVFTETGNTARMISKYRPSVSIYAFSHNGPVCNRMNLLWGVNPVQRREIARSSEDMVNTAERELLHHGQLKTGDVLGVVAGTQMASGSTNFMRLHTVTAPKIPIRQLGELADERGRASLHRGGKAQGSSNPGAKKRVSKEILSVAVFVPLDGYEQQALATIRELSGVLSSSGYSRDVLYQGTEGEYVLVRHWKSEESRRAALENPEAQRRWAKLAHEIRILKVHEVWKK